MLDSFVAGAPEPGRPVRRVVVTLGSQGGYGFERLVRRLVAILPTDVSVVWQTGATDVSDLPVEGQVALPAAQLRAAIRDADVVVTHAGVGSALDALSCGLRPVLVPRRKSRGEHVDDHQLQIAEELVRRNLGVSHDADDLEMAHLAEAARIGVREVLDPPALPFGSGG